VPFRNDAGTVTSVLAVTIDITRRKQMEITLQEQHDQLQNLLNSINGISWEFDLTTNRFTYVSPNSPRILGYSIHEWTDMDSWLDKIIPEDREDSCDYCVSQDSFSTRPRRSSQKKRCVAGRKWKPSANSPAALPTISTISSASFWATLNC